MLSLLFIGIHLEQHFEFRCRWQRYGPKRGPLSSPPLSRSHPAWASAPIDLPQLSHAEAIHRHWMLMWLPLLGSCRASFNQIMLLIRGKKPLTNDLELRCSSSSSPARPSTRSNSPREGRRRSEADRIRAHARSSRGMPTTRGTPLPPSSVRPVGPCRSNRVMPPYHRVYQQDPNRSPLRVLV
ncbi:hypothetical protein GUJ93_ZPchr0010g7472 [Zizania palustris]|uniref:Uncharacterized protein n=1 Tax=Zizania palustris TaxID=103762 RepID=A0A8J5T9M9_ZIZPA|nr:hypothetical protein GUJ93_ZPchr0010g7472 [Zizania palustris]